MSPWKAPADHPPHGPRHHDHHHPPPPPPSFRPGGPGHHVPPHEVTWGALEHISQQLGELRTLVAELIGPKTTIE